MAKYKMHYENEEHESKTKTVLACGNGSGLTLPIGGPTIAVSGCGGAASPPSLIVGTVSLDTRGLEDPTVKIDFSSVINFRAESLLGDFFIGIIFQLSRSSDNGARVALGTWVYEREVEITVPTPPIGEAVAVDFTDPFSFTWCECNDCPACAVYLVEILDIQTTNITNASITSVGINALAVGEACRY